MTNTNNGMSPERNFQDWLHRMRRTRPLELPSGLIIEVRNVSMIDVFTEIDIPEPLVALVDDLINGKKETKNEDGTTSMTIEVSDLTGMKQILRSIAAEVIASPEVCDLCNGDDGRLPLELIPMEDLMHIFEYVSGKIAVGNFREEPHVDVDGSQSGPTVQHAAE